LSYRGHAAPADISSPHELKKFHFLEKVFAPAAFYTLQVDCKFSPFCWKLGAHKLLL
jgi:hypothetical protein